MYPGFDKKVRRLACGYQAQARPVPLSRYYAGKSGKPNARKRDKPKWQMPKDNKPTARAYVMVKPKQPDCVLDSQERSQRPKQVPRYCGPCGMNLQSFTPLEKPILGDDPIYNQSAINGHNFLQFLQDSDKASVGPIGSAERKAFEKEMMDRICYLSSHDPYFSSEHLDSFMHSWETLYWK